MGTRMVPVLLLLSFAVASLISAGLVVVVMTYFVLTMAYSLRLKRHSIVDICTLAALYTIRIVAGAVAIGVSLSVWLLAFSMFTFFALAAAKRLGELSDADAAGRTVTRRGYTVEDRRILSQMAVSAGYVGVLVLALYIDEPEVQDRFGSHRMFWGVCALLIFWISRLVLVANRGEMDDDPLIWAMKDPVSRATVRDRGGPDRGRRIAVTRRALILRYAGFAVVAVAANLATQRLSWRRGGRRRVALRRGAGGGDAGRARRAKYVLDKRWIFYDETRGARAQGRQFFMYSLMGVATTAIFWVTETAFWLIWGTDFAREAGAVLGLTIGYVTKYLLDRRFVFHEARRPA
jgi:hypothetical protein